MLIGAVIMGLAMVQAVAAPKQSGEYYRWQDERGGVVYSDSLPPDKARAAHTVLDSQARKLRDLPPEATREERESLARERAQRAERESVERERAKRDALLLELYASEDSILQARDTRLASIDARSEVLTRQLQDQRERLAMLESQHPRHEEIPGLRLRIEATMQGVERLRQERQRTLDAFAADLERWRALKANGVKAPTSRLSP
ncbi:MAG: DUF4124 domain-containing protein [Halothiobacillaceae bacterium]